MVCFGRFFNSHDTEFHVTSLPYKPDFKLMPEGWDGITRDPDVHCKKSKKEDDKLYEEFVQRFNFNKMEFKGNVKVHKYSGRRASDGRPITAEKLAPWGKRGSGGGFKIVSEGDSSSTQENTPIRSYLPFYEIDFRGSPHSRLYLDV